MTANAPQPSNETEHEQPTETKTFYFFTAVGDKICPECQALNDIWVFHSPPDRPHENCHCQIEQRDLPVKKIRCSSQVTDTFEHVEQIGNISPGNSMADSVNRSETNSSGTFSGSLSAGPASVGYTEGGSSNSKGSSTANYFNYKEEVGGANQMVLAVYSMDEITETCVWVTDTTIIGDGIPPGLEFETTAVKYSEPIFVRYQQEGF